MNLQRLLTAITLCLLLLPAHTQTFQKKLPGSILYSLEALPSGNIVAAGQKLLYDTTLLVSQYTPDGQVLYTQTLNPPGGMSLDNDHVRSLLWVDGDSILFPIYASSGATGHVYPGFVKTDTAANPGWWKRYQWGSLLNSGNPRGGAASVFRSRFSPDYVMAGWSNPGLSSNPYDYGAHIQKTDLHGNVVWSKHLQTGFEFLFDACEAANGDYIFAGGTFKGRVFNTDSAGNFRWSYSYDIGASGSSEIVSIRLTPDSGYIVGGSHTRNSGTDKDGYLMKLDSSGAIVWVKTFGGLQNDYIYNVIPTSDGGFIACGRTQSYGLGNYDGWLIKTDAAGNVAWVKAYGTGAAETLNDVIEVQGTYYAAGITDADGWLIRTLVDGFSGCGEMDIQPTVTDRTNTTLRATVNYNPSSYAEVLDEPITVTTPVITPAYLCTYQDAAITTLVSPVIPVYVCAEQPVVIEFHNNGTDTLTDVPVAYAVNGVTTGLDTIAGPVAPGTSLVFTFTTGWMSSVPGTQAFCVYVDGLGDIDQNNDSICYVYQVTNTYTSQATICQGDSLYFGGTYLLTGGIYTDTLTSVMGCDSIVELTLAVNSVNTPVISASGNILSTGLYAAYQWYLNGQPIVGATSQQYTATANGNYTVEVTDANGCSSESSVYQFGNLDTEDAVQLAGIRLYPNPVAGIMFIDATGISGSWELALYNMEGKLLLHRTGMQNSQESIDLSAIAPGVYMVHITANSGVSRQIKIIKQ